MPTTTPDQGQKTKDDYQWDRYTKEYLWEINHTRTTYGLDFLVRQSGVEGDALVFRDPLHDNWKEIYHQVHRLKAASVFECGCGGCHHLHNIRTLMPHVQVQGCDLLQSQIQTAGRDKLQVPAEILARTMVLDFSTPTAPPTIAARFGETFDFVYTQAVLMHLSHDKARQFIKNMVRLSARHILMVEAPAHDFAALARETGLADAFARDYNTLYVKSAMLWTRR